MPAAPSESARETLAALVDETKMVLAKLEVALSKFTSTEIASVASLPRNDSIEGVFDGKQMVADDGTLYPVPENYASKSKLVEGDLLQRATTPDGRAYFKQVSRVERATITARLERVDTESGVAAGSNGKTYSLLHAPLRFFRATPGDMLTLEVPADGGCWAAVVGKTETCYTESRYVRPVPYA